ncbi:MAG: diacylglycerol kinase [Fretibacterium sp.]|nr:diacylglycerol kinase [Fretibacterium sp.]
MRYRWPWQRLFHATRYSLNGVWTALREEQAFAYEAIVFLGVCTVSALFLPWGKALLLAGAWLAVMALELINGAVEQAFDLIDTHRRPEIKAGKDMLSAAVFLLVCFNIVLWAAVVVGL